ncbi:hypothetical protein FH972_022933 [Carpinus fangiana]|uniref:Transmembrane protein n=1 Tax=Carpinus fangiana TaxID=176857 RepID=A0A5N6KUC9_9ROSI|nr:hypothetical protein FH972_022933 [Carpinus fangiana]
MINTMNARSAPCGNDVDVEMQSAARSHRKSKCKLYGCAGLTALIVAFIVTGMVLCTLALANVRPFSDRTPPRAIVSRFSRMTPSTPSLNATLRVGDDLFRFPPHHHVQNNPGVPHLAKRLWPFSDFYDALHEFDAFHTSEEGLPPDAFTYNRKALPDLGKGRAYGLPDKLNFLEAPYGLFRIQEERKARKMAEEKALKKAAEKARKKVAEKAHQKPAEKAHHKNKKEDDNELEARSFPDLLEMAYHHVIDVMRVAASTVDRISEQQQQQQQRNKDDEVEKRGFPNLLDGAYKQVMDVMLVVADVEANKPAPEANATDSDATTHDATHAVQKREVLEQKQREKRALWDLFQEFGDAYNEVAGRLSDKMTKAYQGISEAYDAYGARQEDNRLLEAHQSLRPVYNVPEEIDDLAMYSPMWT